MLLFASQNNVKKGPLFDLHFCSWRPLYVFCLLFCVTCLHLCATCLLLCVVYLPFSLTTVPDSFCVLSSCFCLPACSPVSSVLLFFCVCVSALQPHLVFVFLPVWFWSSSMYFLAFCPYLSLSLFALQLHWPVSAYLSYLSLCLFPYHTCSLILLSLHFHCSVQPPVCYLHYVSQPHL